MTERKDDGGAAFPFVTWRSPDGMMGIPQDPGMSLRDWFAGNAPCPSEEQIAAEHNTDNRRNPYNDFRKPRLRSRAEIIAALNYAYADAMLAERAKK